MIRDATPDAPHGVIGRASPVLLTSTSSPEKRMSTQLTADVKVKAIAANLEALQALLTDAVKLASEAHEQIRKGECNGAIGAVLGLESVFSGAKALYGAMLVLHHSTLNEECLESRFL
jgi:hypothetical protein